MSSDALPLTRIGGTGAARVPSALSQEMEEERDEKKKEREAKEKEKEKDRPKTPPVESKPPVNPSSNSTSWRLGGGSSAAEEIAGLTPEMRAKVERERRARAAEARLKGLQGS
ncbi:hypothetical protein CVT25_009391 [Psilocybe cyanescens]|uniref:Uncharacterized protein n=1 Tax=Psilocybe cyanescens TaxID=93625 RepID=A0A409XV99_PSICY|nr:hypothetical protein CVT25_009391 [Psilocybe cyanescens]